MIQKETDIHIRVSEKDKKALQRYAKRAGLSLSAYLRMTGLNQQIPKSSQARRFTTATVLLWIYCKRSVSLPRNLLNSG